MEKQPRRSIEMVSISHQSRDSSSVTNREYYEESPYRYYIVISVCLLTFANGLQWVTFSSCFTNFGITYNLPNWKVNMFSLIFMIIYPIVCVPQGYLVDNYSTRLGLMIAAGCTLLGGGLKLLVNHNMTICFMGQFLTGFFQPAILNTPGKIAAKWFKGKMRNLITSILCLADIIGILFGFTFYAFVIDSSIDPETQRDEYKVDFYYYLLCEFLLNLVFCLPTFFITTDEPTYPTSLSQARQKRIPLLKRFKRLFTNKNFIFLLFSTMFVVGYYDVYGTILYSIFALYNIDDLQSSNIYSVSSAIGIIAAILFSIYLDRTQRYRFFFIMITIAGIVLQVVFSILLELTLRYESINPYYIAFVFYSLLNIVVIPFYTIGMNYACEITYPVGESLNGGIMMTMSQLSGISGTFFCEYLMADFPDKKYLVNIVIIVFFTLGFVFIFFIDDHLERTDIDESNLASLESSY